MRKEPRYKVSHFSILCEKDGCTFTAEIIHPLQNWICLERLTANSRSEALQAARLKRREIVQEWNKRLKAENRQAVVETKIWIRR